MKICVTGTQGKSSLISRVMLDQFSIRHKPTTFIEIHHFGPIDVYEIPNTQHKKSMKCDLLIVTCKTQLEIVETMKEWLGKAKITLIVRIGEDLEPESPFLCPNERFFNVSNLSSEGIPDLRAEIRLHINRHFRPFK